MLNSKHSPVLPNFVKLVLIATFAFSTNLATAADHGEAKDHGQTEEKIRDLKDMTPSGVDSENLRNQVTESVSEEITDETTETASERVKEMAEEGKQAITEGAQKKAKTLSIPEG